MKIYLYLLLGLIPVINFCLQYYFSKKEKILPIFQQHRICYRLDRIFIPINVLALLLITTLSRQILLLLGIASLLINYIIHRLRALEKNTKNSHLVNPQVTKAGRVHMVFSSIEMLIIAIILLGPSQGSVIYIEVGLLTIFIAGLNYGAYRIHHKRHRSDILTTLILGAALVIKVLSLTI